VNGWEGKRRRRIMDCNFASELKSEEVNGEVKIRRG
jgi:hypothetical protein